MAAGSAALIASWNRQKCDDCQAVQAELQNAQRKSRELAEKLSDYRALVVEAREAVGRAVEVVDDVLMKLRRHDLNSEDQAPARLQDVRELLGRWSEVDNTE